MADERELSRIARYVDKLTAAGIFHVRERQVLIDNDMQVGGSLVVDGSLSAGSLDTTTTVTTTINSDLWQGSGSGSMVIDLHNSSGGTLTVDNLLGGGVLLSVDGDITLSGTVDGVDISTHAANPDAHHLGFVGLLADSGSATPDANDKITIAGGAGLITSGSSSSLSVALQTPGTLSVSSTNNAAGNHTHAITSSSNPGAAASLLATDSSGELKLVKLGASSNLTIGPAGDVVLDPVGNDVLPNLNYDINLGAINKKYLTLHAAELWVETLVAQNTIATIGGRILVGPTTVLTSDLSSGSTTIYVKHNNLAVGDTVYMEADGKVEFMAITAGPSGTGPYSYTVTRNLDGSGANDWYAGDAVFNTGTAGKGFIDLYSLSGVKSGSGPTIVGNVRNSSTYNDWTEHWAIGNLNGLYGYSSDTYGFAAGKYASGATWVGVDATNGLRMMNYTTRVGQWAPSGWIIVGQQAASMGNLYIQNDGTLRLRVDTTSNVIITSTGWAYFGDSSTGKHYLSIDSSGTLRLRNSSVTRILISSDGTMTINDSSGNAVFTFDASAGAEFTKPLTLGTSGGIYQGTGTFSTPTTGLKIWNSGGIGRIAGYNSGTIQWYADTDGKLYAGGGNVLLAEDGLTLLAPSGTYEPRSAVKFKNTTGANWGEIICDDTRGLSMNVKTTPSGSGMNILDGAQISLLANSTHYVTLSTDGHAYFLGMGVSIGGTLPTHTALQAGPSIPIYLVHDWASIGFNAYSDSGWKFGVGSSGNYAGMIDQSKTSGTMAFRVSNAAGSEGGAITFTTCLTIAPTGNVRFPSIGTTTYAANAYLSSTDSNDLKRSTSSARYKQNIRSLEVDPWQVMALRPVSFESAIPDDPVAGRRQLGLIAEEVASVVPDLVLFDEQGRPDWVQYPMLSVLNLAALQRLVKILMKKGVLTERDGIPDYQA